ncbi:MULTISPECIES: hypothetical protein [unclassified Nostoc]|uniref:hypothetical protein n=1 Tax=unclassified Nostoc TaxID=2593658 RepID=UPI001677ECCB|nr:hypothetical protein [Nostoc sp. 'Peltigera membranacea cyanobiont' 232]
MGFDIKKIIFIILIQQASFFMGAVWWNKNIAACEAASHPNGDAPNVAMRSRSVV